jgi:anti-sigma factor RsiW
MVSHLKKTDDIELSAYCDGELDAAAMAEFERRLENDASLRARYERLMSLRQAIRSLPRAEVPANLRARIGAKLDAERLDIERPGNVVALRRRSWSFQALAASAVLGAVISSSAMLTMQRMAQQDAIASEVVAGHIRGLLASEPFDVASSDRHTVKPWFTARLPESPQVPDLSAQGFNLLGGRIDVIGRNPVATIIYKHAAHTISLTTLRRGQSVPDEVIGGYNVRSWRDANFTYVAVSDLPGADLAAFERAFAAAEPAPEIK